MPDVFINDKALYGMTFSRLIPEKGSEERDPGKGTASD